MEANHWFFLSCFISSIGVIGAIVNFFSLIKSERNMFSIMKYHAVFGLLFGLGLVGAITSGVVWIVNKLN